MANAQTSLDITNSERKKPVPPKQVPNAYQLYQHQNKERVVQENREADEATIMRLLATDWAFLSDKEKRVPISLLSHWPVITILGTTSTCAFRTSDSLL